MTTDGDLPAQPQPDQPFVPPAPPAPTPPPSASAAPSGYAPGAVFVPDGAASGPAGESVSFAGPASGPAHAAPAPARRGRRRIVLGVAGVVVLGLVGGGAVWAYSFLSGGGAQPDTAVPSTAVAYASIDLDPSAGQKIATARFLRKFPDLKNEVSDNGDLLQELFTSATKGDTSNTIDYATEIKPWLGKRGAVAVLPPATTGGTPQPIYVVQVTDEAKARTSIPKLLKQLAAEDDSSDVSSSVSGCESPPGSGVVCPDVTGDSGADSVTSTPPTGLVVRDGYALIAQTQAEAQAASAAAAASPLSKSPTYQADMKQITAPGIASAWVDLGAVTSMLRTAALKDDPGVSFPNVSGLSSGRLVAGLHVDPGYVELQAHAVGGTATPAGTAPGGPMLQQLPADTTGALAVGNVSSGLARAFSTTSIPSSELSLVTKYTGLRIPADLETLLGSRFVVAVGDVKAATPQVGVRVDTTDASGSEHVLDRTITKIGALGDGIDSAAIRDQISRVPTNDGIVYASTPDYANLLAQDGTLGASQAFVEALPAAATADDAFYLSFDRIVAQADDPDVTRDLAPLSALGMTEQASGTTATMDVRLVAH